MLGPMIWIAFAFVGVVMAVVPHVLWLCVWAVAALLGHGQAVHYAPWGWTALGLVVVSLLTMLYGLEVGRFQLATTHTEMRHSQLPKAFDGYKIVQISDFHLSTFDDRPTAVQRIVDSINAQEPDLVCFTGDLVTIGHTEAAPYASMLRGIRAKDGVVSVMGNHDMLIYTRLPEKARQEGVESLAAFERDSLGWTLLRNAHRVLHRTGADGTPCSLTIVGVDNIAYVGTQGFHTINCGNLPQAMEGTEGFRILLSHDPSHWRGEVLPHTDIALTLSGHTHAGQIKLGTWAASRVSFHDSDGWYAEGEQQLYVNQGLGCTAPFRFHCPAEITVITLRCAADE